MNSTVNCDDVNIHNYHSYSAFAKRFLGHQSSDLKGVIKVLFHKFSLRFLNLFNFSLFLTIEHPTYNAAVARLKKK